MYLAGRSDVMQLIIVRTTSVLLITLVQKMDILFVQLEYFKYIVNMTYHMNSVG